MKLFRKNIFILLSFCSCILLPECKSSYYNVNPEGVNYVVHYINDGISFSYQDDILVRNENQKRVIIDNTNTTNVLAVRITNHTNNDLNILNDVSFYLGQNKVTPIKPDVLKSKLPKDVIKLLQSTKRDSLTRKRESSLINYFRLGKNDETPTTKNLEIDQFIKTGETAFLILGFENPGYYPLSVKLNK